LAERVATDEAVRNPGPIWDHFVALAPLIKHPAFRAEGEWRIVPVGKLTMGTLKFFARGPLLVPFAELQLPSDVIGRVVVGPQAHQELAEASITAYGRNTDGFIVESSKTPFRNIGR
jgi:hypothetical protein